ncbi:hypothetical protein [Ktedonospora formicarum]|uniref:Uncharacterized protein n=1 Tax=Ktedonospora formicarum TaxID=2778364 RepID=A0A8J3MSE0_9CHLR|nr:hypothetical protein [Ktedonospora formicarum]GHO44518.1 hypothetical protein KSX_26810 [Ktedonospora formicarum]
MIGIIAETASSIFSVDFDKEIRRGLHMGAGVLRDMMEIRVRVNTPQLTGALIQDIKGTYATSVSSDTLAEVHAESEHQLDTWKRVYVQYVEGPPLGLATYTNPPRQMFNHIANDTGFIEDWAVQYTQLTLDNIVNGTIV